MPRNPSSAPDKPAPPRASTWVLWGLIAMVVLLLMPFPYSLGGGIAGAVVFAAGVVALAKSRRGSSSFAVALLIGSTLLGGFTVASSLASLAVFDLMSEQKTCLDDAITNEARRQCEEDFQQGLDERLGQISGGEPAEQ